MIDYSLILIKNYSGKQWSVSETYDSLQWLDETPKPTQAELDSQWESVKKSIADNEYKNKRAKEYPSFADQFDLLYHGGYDAWKAQIQAVKDKYPKA